MSLFFGASERARSSACSAGSNWRCRRWKRARFAQPAGSLGKRRVASCRLFSARCRSLTLRATTPEWNAVTIRPYFPGSGFRVSSPGQPVSARTPAASRPSWEMLRA